MAPPPPVDTARGDRPYHIIVSLQVVMQEGDTLFEYLVEIALLCGLEQAHHAVHVSSGGIAVALDVAGCRCGGAFGGGGGGHGFMILEGVWKGFVRKLLPLLLTSSHYRGVLLLIALLIFRWGV